MGVKMQVLSIQKTENRVNNMQRAMVSKPVSAPVYPQRNEISNVYYMPLNMNNKKTSFGGLRLETNVIQKVKGKQFQGAGLYKNGKDFIDFLKVGYDKLATEPLNILKATKAEIVAHRFALALAETYAEGSSFGTQWVKRYNPENRRSPLAVSHSLNSDYMKENYYVKNLEYLYDLDNHKELDIPITDKNGKLNLDAIVFDTETTGPNPKVDKIVQIATIPIKKGQVTKFGVCDQLINPEIPMPAGAEAVHGISDEMVKDMPTIEKFLKKFTNQVINKKNGVLCAYNAKFDVPLLNREIREHNIYSSDHIEERNMAEVLDPFLLIQRIHPFLGAKKKLGFQYHWLFCKPMENAHDALADVTGTADVLKYCLYYLSEHRKDKTVPLTLREVLIFQNGGHGVENIDIPLDASKNYNKNFKFDKSYRAEPLDVDNYFQGYKLTEKVIKDLEPEIGSKNVQKLLNQSVGGAVAAQGLASSETEQIKDTNTFKNMSYVLADNFKKVLGFAELEEFNGKSPEEIIDTITDHSKRYLHEKTKEIWLKNVDPDDIAKGNDLPDDEIAKRVMRESEQAKAADAKKEARLAKKGNK